MGNQVMSVMEETKDSKHTQAHYRMSTVLHFAKEFEQEPNILRNDSYA